MLAANGRAAYYSATDAEALSGFQLLAATEGIVPALEPAHAIGWLAREVGRRVPEDATVLVTLSGRGDKDASQVAEMLTGEVIAGTASAGRGRAGADLDPAVVPDRPLDVLDGWTAAADHAHVETVLLAAPTTTEERLRAICTRSRGFVYGVALLGITGERSELAAEATQMGRR